jgi:RNA polymerase sigma-70 factor (ECF subfamily)
MLSDEKLIAAYLEGDDHSLENLIERYANHIYNFIRHYIHNLQEAEDLTQDVFIKVWKHIRKFDLSKSFKVWIFQIARNTAIDFLRKKKEISFSDMAEEDDVFETPDLEPLPSELLEKKESQKMVKEALEQMPLKYREVLTLYFQNQLNFREISEINNESIDTVKSRHRRGLLILKKRLLE